MAYDKEKKLKLLKAPAISIPKFAQIMCVTNHQKGFFGFYKDTKNFS